MAVIARCESGFLVDHQREISETASLLSLSCKESLFALFEPYFRTSADTKRRKRKKSSKVDLNEEDVEASLHHQKVKETIVKGFEQLVKCGVANHYFLNRPSDHSERDHLLPALPEDTIDLAELVKLSSLVPEAIDDYPPPVVVSKGNAFNDGDLFSRIITHVDDTPTILSIFGGQYILPAKSTFLMSDATNLEPLVQYARENSLYSMVVLDPPWFNKSAKRGSKYSFMSLWQIKSLPVPQLLAPGALVGIWVTNKQKYLRFTKTELFPHWSVELVAEWYWVKVTRKGELVTDLDSPHKKPYELLLIGRYRPQEDNTRSSDETVTTSSQMNPITVCTATCKPGLSKSDKSLTDTRKRKIDEFDNGEEMAKKRCNCYTGCEMNGRETQVEENMPHISVTDSDPHAEEYGCQRRQELDKVLCRGSPMETIQNCANCHKRYHQNKLNTQGEICSLGSPDPPAQRNQSECKSECCCEVALETKESNCGAEACGDVTGSREKDVMTSRVSLETRQSDCTTEACGDVTGSLEKDVMTSRVSLETRQSDCTTEAFCDVTGSRGKNVMMSRFSLETRESDCASEACSDVTGSRGKDVMTSGGCKALPYHRVICSVPCRIHSRKPPLNAILADFLPSNSSCLEMFARNLTPNWTSWGNEVLKFQSLKYYDVSSPQSLIKDPSCNTVQTHYD